ncbi:hypothetical protein WM22_24805 [Burkholderia ubonensis]|nr:hypothetical protein WK99_09135 [Burkholderia ubonensis]KWK94350.1 hypothetical protein WM19_20500 [Burkholderia ubonensis]KWN04074.1 hypothetical protein WM20_00315 [Burkholderia ubonensis]KWN29775.1 hypothetical protein WM22_24805 [Burkholderia ubonensis]ODQ31904.1 hypothetical protein BGV64_06945 [Burkholderia ubonensis]
MITKELKMRELNHMETANVAGAWSWSDITTGSILAMFRPAPNTDLTVREAPELTGGAVGMGDTFGKVAVALVVGGMLLAGGIASGIAGGIGAGLMSLARR